MKKFKLNASEKVEEQRKKLPREDAWYRLDNSGALYPMLKTLNFMSLFRMGVMLTEPIDPKRLEKAAIETLNRYPGFRVSLRTGFFRYFFDYNPELPVVVKDTGVLFRKIDFRKNNRYLFRLSYFENRISIDYWHCLTDGAGAMDFLKTLVYTYLTKFRTCPSTEPAEFLSEETPSFIGTAAVEAIDDEARRCIKLATDAPKEAEYEDSFLKYYRKFGLVDGIGKMTEGKVFPIRGKHFVRQGYGLIEGRLKTTEVLKLAKENGGSVTELIVALIMISITKVYGNELLKGSGGDLVALVPINLRGIFPSETLRNFVMMAKTRVNPKTTPNTLKDFVAVVKAEMAKAKDKELLLDKISFTSLMDKLWILRILPQFVKTFFTKVGIRFSIKPQQSFILSNLGRVQMPDDVKDDIKDFHFYVNCNNKSPENVSTLSYGDTTIVCFTRFLKSTALDRAFFTTLSELGLSVSVCGNYRELYKRGFLHALPKM